MFLRWCILVYCFVAEENTALPDVVPIFISVDPHRDSVKAVAEYVKGQWKVAYMSDWLLLGNFVNWTRITPLPFHHCRTQVVMTMAVRSVFLSPAGKRMYVYGMFLYIVAHQIIFVYTYGFFLLNSTIQILYVCCLWFTGLDCMLWYILNCLHNYID